jgi:amidase
MVPVAHAGDGGGSIRIPANHCGLFGLKPSRGRVSLGPEESESWAGLVARHVVARSVRDSAAVLDQIQGYMPGDYYSAPEPKGPYASEVGRDPGKLRIGVRTTAASGLAETLPECVAATEDAAKLLESLGHTVEVASPAALDEPGLLELFTAVLMSSLMADFKHIEQIAGRPITENDVEPSTWLYAAMAPSITGGDYVIALHHAHSWVRRVASWWFDDGYDLLLTPTCCEPPPEIGDVFDRPDEPSRAAARALPFAAHTAPFNVTGQPAMSVPTYMSGGLPIGVQLVGAPNREDVLFRVAAQLEAARPWAESRPPVHA